MEEVRQEDAAGENQAPKEKPMDDLLVVWKQGKLLFRVHPHDYRFFYFSVTDQRRGLPMESEARTQEP